MPWHGPQSPGPHALHWYTAKGEPAACGEEYSESGQATFRPQQQGAVCPACVERMKPAERVVYVR